MMDTSVFEDLGLTQAEIKVYLSLLNLGSSTAGPILEKSNLQNSVVHRSLNNLIEKGIVNFILDGKKKIYQAINPEEFINFIEDKKLRFKEIIPQLKQNQGKIKEQAAVYKGKKGINEIYNRLINSGGKEYNTFGGGKRVTYEIMGEDWWYSLHTKRITKKIKSKQIFDETIRKFGEELKKRPFSDVKFLSQEFEQLTETIICGNLVSIIIFTENPYGLLIEDKIVVDGYKKYFEELWKIAKK
jgi:sugar-specific transcriptional regulator TrmB